MIFSRGLTDVYWHVPHSKSHLLTAMKGPISIIVENDFSSLRNCFHKMDKPRSESLDGGMGLGPGLGEVYRGTIRYLGRGSDAWCQRCQCWFTWKQEVTDLQCRWWSSRVDATTRLDATHPILGQLKRRINGSSDKPCHRDVKSYPKRFNIPFFRKDW